MTDRNRYSVRELNTASSKSTKTFRFVNFSERLKQLNVDVFRRVGTFELAPDQETSSFFREQLEEWVELDCTAQFTDFAAEVWPLSESLPLVVFNRDKIIEAIIRHITIPNTPSLKALLTLTGTLARDLRHAFLPHFKEVLVTLCNLVDPKDPENLEEIFSALGHLFKHLYKYLLPDLPGLFDTYVTLISHRRKHVRHFAAESFAFLLRKIDAAELPEIILSLLAKATRPSAKDSLREGLAFLIFETIKGLKLRLHSRAELVFNTTLSLLLPTSFKVDAPANDQDDESDREDDAAEAERKAKRQAKRAEVVSLREKINLQQCYGIVDSTFRQVLNHVLKGGSAEVLWKVLIKHANELVAPLIANEGAGSNAQSSTKKSPKKAKRATAIKEEVSPRHVEALVGVAGLLETCASFRTGALLPVKGSNKEGDDLLTITEALCRSPVLATSDDVCHAVLQYIAALIKPERYRPFLLLTQKRQELTQRLLNSIFSLPSPLDLLPLFEPILKTSFFGTHLLPLLAQYCETATKAGKAHELLRLLATLIASEAISSSEPLSLPDQPATEFVNFLFAQLEAGKKHTVKSLWAQWAVVRLLPCLELEAQPKLRKRLAEAVEKLLSELISSDASLPAKRRYLLLHSVITSLAELTLQQDNQHAVTELVNLWPNMIEALKVDPSNPMLLQGVQNYFTTLIHGRDEAKEEESSDEWSAQLTKLLSWESLCTLLPIVGSNIASPNSIVRKATLSILSHFHVPMPPDTHNPLVVMCEAEHVELSIQTAREITLLMRRVVRTALSSVASQIPKEIRRLVPHFFIGCMRTPFSMVWDTAVESLAELAGSNTDVVWPILVSNFTTAVDETVGQPKNEAKAEPETMEVDGENEGDSSEEAAELDQATQVESRSTDALTFCGLLFRTLFQIPGTVARRSKDIVPLFFQFLRQRYDRLFPPLVFPPNYPLLPEVKEEQMDTEEVIEEEVEDDEEEDEDDEEDAEESKKEQNKKPKQNNRSGSRKAARSILENYLKLFSAVASKKIHQADQVKAAITRLLARSEPPTQKLAVECLAGWGDSHLNPYKEHILKLIDMKTWRNEMTLFTLDPETTTIGKRHRQYLIPLLIPILCGKLLAGKGKSKETTDARRSAVLSYAGGMTDSELLLLLDFLLQPFQRALQQCGDPCGSAVAGKFEEVDKAVECVSHIPLTRQVGFLGLSHHLYKQLPHRIAPHVGRLFTLTLLLLANSYRMPKGKDSKEVRKLALKRIGEILEKVPSEAAGGFKREVALLFYSLSADIADLPARCGQSSPILRCLVVLTTQASLADLFDLHPSAVPQILRCFGAKDPAQSVSAQLIRAVENLLYNAPRLITPHVDLLLEQIVASDPYAFWSSIHRQKLRIIENVAPMATTERQVGLLLQVLMPLLNHRSLKTIGRDGLESVLSLYSAKLPVLGAGAATYLPSLSNLVATLSLRTSRLLLFGVLQVMAKTAPALKIKEAVAWIQETSAYSTTEVGAFDYARRQKAYKQFEEGHCDAWVLKGGVAAGTLVANALLFSVADHDTGISEPASHALSRFLRLVTKSGNEELENIGNKTILPLLHRYLRGNQRHLRKYSLLLLRDHAEITPGSYHADLVVLNPEVDHKAGMSAELLEFVETEKRDDMEEEQAEEEDGEKKKKKTKVKTNTSEQKLKNINFFDDIFNIKRGRIVKALAMFQHSKILDKLRPGTISRVLIPFLISEFVKSVPADVPILSYTSLLNSILTMMFVQENKSKVSQVDGNVMNETAQAIGALSTRLYWNAYYSLLSNLFRLVMAKSHLANYLIKIICAVLGRFPFTETLKLASKEDIAPPPEADVKAENQQEGKQSEQKEVKQEVKEEKAEATETKEEEDDEEEETEEIKQEEQEATLDDVQKANKIKAMLLNKVVPTLTRLLTDPSDTSKVVRPPIAIALINILSLFPESMESRLPSVIIKVTQNMRNRMENVREVTRETMRGMLTQLGPRYLRYVVQSLKTVLTKGFELHVLGHAIHDLLQHLENRLHPGDLDDVVDEIVPVLIDHLLGEVARQKDIDAIRRKTREARQLTLPYHIYQILAKRVSFSKLPQLIEPLKNHLEESSSLADVKKITDVLRHVAMGLAANSSAKPTSVLIYIHSLLSQYLQPPQSNKEPVEEKANAESIKALENKKKKEAEENKYLIAELPAPGNKFKRTRREKAANLHVLAEFGLEMLLALLRKRAFSTTKEKHIQMLNPFFPMLANPLTSLPDRSALLAMKCISTFVTMNVLPSTQKSVPLLIDNTLRLLQKGEVESKVGQTCLKTLTQCLKYDAAFTAKQLTGLLKIVETALDELNDHPRTFALIQMILNRRLIAPEVYDLARRLGTLAVQHTAGHIRSSCRRMLSTFLLHYPLGDKRMEQQISFFVDNLNYIHESGRESAMEMLHYIFNKLPEEKLEEKSMYFFIPLVLRLVNDESARLRGMAGALITSLLRRLPDAVFSRLYGLTVGWYANKDEVQSESAVLRRAAAQVLGLMLDAQPQRFVKKKKMQKLLTMLLSPLLKSATKMISPDDSTLPSSDDTPLGDEEGTMSASGAKWSIEYYSLRVIEKAITLDSTLAAQGRAGGLWETCDSLLVADHAWVRSVSARILGVHFSSWQQKDSTLASISQSDADEAYLAEPGRLFKLAKKHSWMLTAPSHLLPPALLTQLLKNLLFLSLAINANPSLVVAAEKDDSEDEEAEQEQEQDDEEEAEDTGKARKKERKDQEGNPALHWLFRKIAYIARKPGNDERRSMALRWFAGMAARLEQDMKPYLIPTIGALYRIGDSREKAEEGIKDTAIEVTDLVQRVVGHTAYYDAYSQVRTHVAHTRMARKRQRAVQAVVDPEAAARKKQKKHRKETERKKRKAEPFMIHKQTISIRSKKHRPDTDQ